MSDYYKVGKDKILDYAKKIGYDNKRFNRGRLSDTDKKNICKLYESQMTSGEIAKIYHVPRGIITKVWWDNNLKGKDIHKYPFNYNYFANIDSKDKAYFLGWLASDGNVFKRKNSPKAQAIIKIALDSKDYLILETLKKYIESNKPLTFLERTTPKGLYRESAILELVSDKIAEDLAKYNIVPAKTYEYELIDLREDLMSHFIRGYFDGDGSIACDHTYTNYPSNYISSISGYEHNLIKFKKHLAKYNIKSEIRIDKRKKHNEYDFGNLSIRSVKDNYYFFKYIYKDMDDLYLARKKYIADCFMASIKNNYSNKQNKYQEILDDAVLNETNM